MIEPVGVTLGAIALLFPIYDACDRLHHGYSLTRSFGPDFQVVQFELEMQWCRLDVTSRRRLTDLENPFQTDDAEHPQTRSVIKALSLIKKQFELSNKLIEKYLVKEKEGELHVDQALPSAGSSISTPNISLGPLSTSTRDVAPSSCTSITAHVATPVNYPRKKLGVKSTVAQFGNAMSRPFRHGRSKQSQSQTPKHISARTSASSNTPLSWNGSTPMAAQTQLDSALVVAIDEQQAQERRDLRDCTRFSRKVVWVQSDKEALRQIITILKDLNSFLETVLIMKPTQDPTRLLVSAETAEQEAIWLSQAKVVQSALMRLHDSLRHMNTAGNDHGIWNLSVKLATNFQENRTAIVNNLYGLTLRDQDGAYYCNLKRQQQKSPNKASLFVAESMLNPEVKAPSESASGPTDSAWHLDQPDILKQGQSSDVFKNWGTVWTDIRPQDIHRLFHAEEQVSQVSGTLPDMLKNEHATQMTRAQRVDLAHLIAISYIHFSLVRQSCNDIRPSSFRYYSTSEKDDAWIGDDLLILKPYLDIGFGQRPPMILGESSGVSKAQSPLVVGLGLLLFQIGCCMAVPYNMSSQAMYEAKRKALFNLHLLDIRVSPAFTEVTQACLQYTPAVARKGGSVDRFLEGVVSRLLSLQDERG